jgi:hypothetical protein
MNEQQISLQSVNDLRLVDISGARRFFVPAYQRGFRWSRLQVTQLLEDIREFVGRPNPTPDDFYCLQPLVIKALADGRFEVVDGQQRLTTLFLLLRHFNERLAERFQQTLYELEYETRPGLTVFLEQPTAEAANDNADFHHFYSAIRAIEDWFAERETEVEEIKTALLKKTKVIWFQLADSDNPVDAFTRLNVGKIPLTNDELIRALFLRRSSDRNADVGDFQLHIAYEWDQIEKALQSDPFWFFLNNEASKTANRIGFLFELVAQAQGLTQEHSADAYGIFHHFNARLGRPGANAELEWRAIKQVFLTLEEWFEDRTLFHMVGFLVSGGMSINRLRALSEGCSKSDFEAKLRAQIFLATIGTDLPAPADMQVVRDHVEKRLDALAYPLGRREIRQILLLFNVATLLMNVRSNIRFQFDSFKREQWDIEHVRSVTDDKPERYDDRRAWLSHCLDYLQTALVDESLCADIEAFLLLGQPQATNDVFDPLYERVLAHFQEDVDSETKHGISNLALLDARTNRSYKNAVFAVKRMSILTLDQTGIFVPLCTRNVFLKCYSPQVVHAIVWSDEDREGYEAAITDVLVRFFIGIQGAAL